ncbi:prenyltransferase/squalene oxidase repeat-containing protein [Streptomyces sp. JNUCC 64]
MGTDERTARRARAGRRPLALGTAVLLALGLAVAWLTGAPPAEADPVERCTASVGAVVAVDFGPFGGGVVRGCDTTPTTGYELLREGGFTTTGTVHDGDGFVCRIGTASFDDGTPYPTPDEEDCVLTPQSTAYWSYWTASPGQKRWTYSPLGALSRTLRPGDVDAWVFGGTDVGGGGSGRPAFSPDDVRAGGGGPTPTGPTGPSVPPGSVDVAAATRWLTGKLTDGERVVDEGSSTPNHALTTEVVYALAAVDRKSPVARKAADFLAAPARTDAFAYPDGGDGVPDAGAAARLALVAEATGKDPRDFGGHDLLGDLVKHVCPRDIGDGETVPGCLTKGDFRTTGQADAQAMAVIALLNGGVTPPAHAVDRLTGLQCEDGGFTGVLIRSGEWCDSDAASTGLIALALERAGGHDRAVERARAHLKGTQSADGSWPSVSYQTTGSPGATGWAAQALRALGDARHADAGLSWLSRQQLPGGGFGFEEGEEDPRIFATTTVTVAAAKSDLVALTTRKTAPPVPTPTPTTPTPTTTAPPAGDRPDLRKGTAYLTDRGRLIHGRYYENAPGSGFADYGLTIDGAYALAATGHDDATLRDVVDFLDGGGEDGTGRDLHDWTGVGTAHAGGGSLGKAALLAEVVGRDPRDFGGQDLIEALARAVCPDRSTPPRPCAARGNYRYATSVFSQALGVMAQVRAGETAAAKDPVAYLKSLQEPSGAWPSLIGEASRAEVDSTAMAAMALDLLPDADSRAAVDEALDWLAARQLADGGFPGAAGNSVNSAALAVQALSLDADRYADRIARARGFLAARQNADGGFTVVKGGRPRSDVRASAQAVGGATGISFGTLTRDLDGTTPRPVPGSTPRPSASPSPPDIVTPGGDGPGGTTGTTGSAHGPAAGTGGSGGTAGAADGGLASTGARVGLLGAAAVVLVLGGWGATRAARRRGGTEGGA